MAVPMRGILMPSNILSGSLFPDAFGESPRSKASGRFRKSSSWGTLEQLQSQASDSMERRYSGMTVKPRLGRSQAVATPIPKTKQRIFRFGKGRSEGNKSMKSLLGGKGANLAEMASIGLSVPPGLTISTETCQEYQDNRNKLPDVLWEEVLEALKTVEKDMNAALGDPLRPLLLSVRSGAAISMPGMMDTVLNLGLNDDVVTGLATKSGERFAYDSYRRFLHMFGDVVMGISHSLFAQELESLKAAKGVALDTDLTADDLKELVVKYEDVYIHATGKPFPSDPKEQLRLAVIAVFDSWNSPRAIKYRNINQITGLKGTAVNVQSMVFGNMGPTSGTGVLFTRNPSTGEKKLYGEFLVNAQGEDVVAGIRTPEDVDTMKQLMPEAYNELVEKIKAGVWPTTQGGTGLVLLERWFVQFRSKTGVGVPAGRSNRVMTDCTRSSSMPNIAVEGNVSKKPEAITNKTERGTVQGSLLPPLSPHALEVPVVYKQTILMLRSVYSMTRLLPVYRLFRLSSASPRDCSFTLSYRISASPSTDVDDAEMIPFCFTPVDTRRGQMIIKVIYRTGTSVTALEVGNPGSPHIIADYVGSPTTEPMKKLSGEPLAGSVPIDGYLQRRIHVVCLPSSMPNSPPGPAFGWHQWWKGGLENVQQTLQPPSPSPSIGGSPLSHSDLDNLQMSFSSQLLGGSLDNKSSRNHGNRTVSLPIPIVQNQHSPASPSLHAGGLPLSCDDMNKSPASSSSQLSASATDGTFDMRSAQYHRKLSFNLTVQHYHQVSSSVALGGSELLQSNLDYVSSSSQTAVPTMDVAVDMKSEKCHGKLNVSLPIPIVQHHNQQASSSPPVHGYPLPCSNSDNTCTNPSGQITLPNNPGHNENLIVVPIPLSQHACSQASCLPATVKSFSSRGLRHSGSAPINICTGFTVPSQDAFKNQGTSSEQLAPDISVAEVFETTMRMAHVRRPFVADSGEKKAREYEEVGDIEDDACPFPFAIDDVEVEQRRIKSIHDCGTAAGELVQKLKSAAPLGQHVRDPVSGNSMYIRGSGSPARRVITHSVPQKVKTLSDALEELIAYKEMRDHLLRQSGRK